ncbi:MAG: RNA polymerase sigma factor [Oscillospiraceae bacterium]
MEDEKIIELYFARSEAAITETSAKYGAFFRRISRNILNSEQDAEECVNDTYLKAWNSIPPKRPDKLPAYLGRIVRNLSLNRWNKLNAAKRGAGEVTLALDELEECIPAADTVQLEADRAEISGALNRFLRELSEEKRTVFLRRYWYLVPVKDIAEQLGMSESKVKSMLLRTRNQLREFLEKEDITI